MINKNKSYWKKFFEYWKDKKVVMHCKTKEDAESFCKIMHDNGLKWCDGDSYLENIYWDTEEEYTCYYFNEGSKGNVCWCGNSVTVLEFEDFRDASIKVAIHSDICKQLTDMYEAKNSDYGDSFAILRNEYPDAILVRLFDKYTRLKTLLHNESHEVDESIEDTLLDMANYCILEVIERKLNE